MPWDETPLLSPAITATQGPRKQSVRSLPRMAVSLHKDSLRFLPVAVIKIPWPEQLPGERFPSGLPFGDSLSQQQFQGSRSLRSGSSDVYTQKMMMHTAPLPFSVYAGQDLSQMSFLHQLMQPREFPHTLAQRPISQMTLGLAKLRIDINHDTNKKLKNLKVLVDLSQLKNLTRILKLPARKSQTARPGNSNNCLRKNLSQHSTGSSRQ